MIRWCGWHEKYFGKKLYMGKLEPLNDKSETTGICKDCSRKLKEGYAEYRRKQMTNAEWLEDRGENKQDYE